MDVAVVTPTSGFQAGRELVLHFFRDQVKHLHPVDPLPRQLRAIGHDHGLIAMRRGVEIGFGIGPHGERRRRGFGMRFAAERCDERARGEASGTRSQYSTSR